MAYNSASQDLRAQIEITARSFLSRFEEGSAQQNASLINCDVTPDCKRYVQPTSVTAAFGMPADYHLDNLAFQNTFAEDIKKLKFKKNVMSNLVVDTEAKRASFTSVSDVETNSGETFQVEQAWFLYFSENGLKITKVVEFCDKDALLKMANVS